LETPVVIEVNNLSIAFKTDKGENVAVENLNLRLYKGEITGIVGESGSGKSVTALALMKLLQCPPAKITSGKILFYGDDGQAVDINKMGEKQMRQLRGHRISMIFQEPMTSLNPVYRCGEQVAEVIREHQKISVAEAKKKVISLFEEVLLPRPEEIFKSYPHQISGGQKQRVMIAMAIANNPSVIIADEPTTALDVTVQKTILQLLKNIRDKYQVAVIFITHDLGVVADIADKVVVMYKGRCVEENTVSRIFSAPIHPYTHGLLACRPDMRKRLKQLPTVSDFLNNEAESEVLKNVLSVEVSQEERSKNHHLLYHQEPLIKVQNLNKSFIVSTAVFSFKPQVFKVLKNINFEVYKGETLGLVGESGCGKTTLGRTLLRLIEPTSGEIFYQNRDITKISKNALRALRPELQIVFQDPYSSLNPRMTIGQAILEPMVVHHILPDYKMQKQRAVELLERVGLDPKHFDRYPHELSGGQRQRVVIARTLVLNPKFIVCDESVSALDVSVQAQVLNLLNELKHEFGLTYIFISHDLSVVKYLADRIIIMKEGEIVESNEADALYAHPQHTYTQKLISAIPKIEVNPQ